jgi:hypothetical protein
MLTTLAATAPANDPVTFYFTQGVLGVTVVVLALVIRFIYTDKTKREDAKDAEIKALNAIILANEKTHTADYRDMAKNDQTVLLSNAQAQELLASKIEITKGRR